MNASGTTNSFIELLDICKRSKNGKTGIEKPMIVFSPLYVNIFSDPLNEGSAGFIPGQYRLPGKDFFLHTA